MVWKVFAPRFMAGAAMLLVIDLGVAVGMFGGLEGTEWKVGRSWVVRDLRRRAAAAGVGPG